MHLNIFYDSGNTIYDTSGHKWLSFPDGHTVKLSDSVDNHFWGEVGSSQNLSPPTIIYKAAHFCPSVSASIAPFRVAITDPPI